MRQYHDTLKLILAEGDDVTDRTGTGTISYVGTMARYPLKDGFPLVTTKKLHLRSIIHELLWFLSGDTNIRYLKENKVRIWDEWADENGDLGPVYGRQWRKWETYEKIEGVGQGDAVLMRKREIDQIQRLVDTIKKAPDSRRLIVSAWNPADIEEMALPPCHTMWQVKINNGNMDLVLTQRSGDMFLGVPFNIASYAMLLQMLAHVTGHHARTFVHSIIDAHIYKNHLEQVDLQLTREPLPLPTLRFARKVDSIFDFKFEDFIIEGYEAHPHIAGEVSV